MFYEIVKFIINNYNYYCIWFSNEDTEGFITENNKLVIYYNKNDAKRYAFKKKIILSKRISIYNFDSLIEYIEKNNCIELLNFWNIFRDISACLKLNFCGNKRDEETNQLYNKLFCGNNILTDEKNMYFPVWEKDEINLIKKIMYDGVTMVKKNIKKQAEME